jgi:nitrogen fixation protein
LIFVVIPKEALESIVVIGNVDVLGDKVSKD